MRHHTRETTFSQLIRTRRTNKAFEPAPLEPDELDELFELARWAPNHHLTNPWRFRVVGPDTRAQLKIAAGPETASKLDRAPTLIVASVVMPGDDQLLDDENFVAASCATFILLLAAHDRGFAGYWRTPEVLRTAEGRAACSIPKNEKILGLIHLGRGKEVTKDPPERADLDEFRMYLG